MPTAPPLPSNGPHPGVAWRSGLDQKAQTGALKLGFEPKRGISQPRPIQGQLEGGPPRSDARHAYYAWSADAGPSFRDSQFRLAAVPAKPLSVQSYRKVHEKSQIHPTRARSSGLLSLLGPSSLRPEYRTVAQ